MAFKFTFILLFLVITSGLIAFIDKFILKPTTSCKVAEYAKSFFWILLVVFIIRSFVIQPFVVPSQSLEPTVIPGDFIAVNQFAYGLRFPVWNKKFINIGKPKRGDIAVFHWPVDPKINFVKRVIGLPGDKISYINKVLYINGKMAKQKFIKYTLDTNYGKTFWKVKVMQENLNGVKHKIYICAKDAANCPGNELKAGNFYNLKVPKGQYFMMGDNRDDSDDSRGWGFVPEKDLVGHAFIIWMSWGGWKHPVRFSRIGISL